MYSFMVLCLTTSCKSDDDAVNLAITEAQVEQMTNNVVAVMDKISTKFSQCDNASDFYNAAVALKQMEGVKDVYESEGSVFVEFENSLEISYLFPPVDEEETLAASLERNISAKTRSDDAKLSSQHVHANMQSLCIVNQLYKDMKFKKNNDIIANLRTEYSRFPISFKVVEGGISRQFFSDDLYNYDMVFLMTHGCYNEKTNLHWILTGQELYTSEEAVENEDLKWKNLDQLKEIMRNHVNLGAKIGIGVVTEKRLIGGREKNVVVYYEKMGVYKLLLNGTPKTVIKQFYEDTLGPLEDYDKSHTSNLMETLYYYLEHECSIKKTADHEVVHRNTILYKFNKIEQILGISINNEEDKLAILMAFKIRRLL